MLTSVVSAAPVTTDVVFDPASSYAGINLGIDAGVRLFAEYERYDWEGSFLGGDFVLAETDTWEWTPIDLNWDYATQVSNPGGTANISFDAPSLESGRLNSLDIDLKGTADWSVSMPTFEYSTTLFGVVPFSFSLDAMASIDSLTWTMMDAPNGSQVAGTSSPLVSYDIDPSGEVNGTVTGSLTPSLSIMFLPFDLGGPYSLSQDFSLDQTLTGTMSLEDLDGEDLGVNVDAALPDWSIPAIDEDGDVSFSTYTGIPMVPYYNVTLGYEIEAGAFVQTPHVDLNGVVADVVPEPVTVALLGIGGLFGVTRRRIAR